jgi:hypothetical protein
VQPIFIRGGGWEHAKRVDEGGGKEREEQVEQESVVGFQPEDSGPDAEE